MANMKFSSELINYALFKAGERIDGTSDFQGQALIYLNAAYKKIWQGGSEFDPEVNEDWTWLREETNIILQVKIDTGTVSVTNDSASATLSASQATDVAGWFFKVDNHEGIFQVSTHGGSSASLTLDSVYTGDDNATANYKLVKLDYTLASDALELLSPMYTAHSNGGERGRIDGLSPGTMRIMQLLSGVPSFFSQIDATTVRFNRYPNDDLIRIDYGYKKLPADLTNSGSEEPLVPLHHRHVLANMVLFDLYSDKNDDRADTISLIAKQGIRSMAVENQSRLATMDDNYGKIHPRLDLNTLHRLREPYTGVYKSQLI